MIKDSASWKWRRRKKVHLRRIALKVKKVTHFKILKRIRVPVMLSNYLKIVHQNHSEGNGSLHKFLRPKNLFQRYPLHPLKRNHLMNRLLQISVNLRNFLPRALFSRTLFPRSLFQRSLFPRSLLTSSQLLRCLLTRSPLQRC
jgi:hypothetical protein